MAPGITFWNNLPPRRRWTLAVGAAVIVALAAALAWWALRPSYAVLYGSLRPAAAAEIATTLDGMQVPHRFADNGATVLVPEDAVYDTRMKLVAQNVPHGSSVGFEVFKDSDFGVTEFAQRVNYQRALQGELERTIASIDEVEAARVHLTLRRSSMFDAQEAPAKASVSLSLRQGASLLPAQVAGIQRLVASAVDGLAPESVVVLGDGGSPLAGGGRGSAETADAGQVEARLRQRIDSMLRETLGEQARYAVSVDVRINDDRIKRIRDSLVPQGKDGNGLLTHQRMSNARLSTSTDAEGNKTTMPSGGDAELDFAHSREQEETEVAPGRIERISIGVMVPSSLDAPTLAKLQSVIEAGAGLDASRGDRLTIAALPLAVAQTAPSVAPRAVPSASQDPFADVPMQDVWWAVGAAIALLVLGLLAWRVLRRPRPARLTHEAREALLADVRVWIESPEHSL